MGLVKRVANLDSGHYEGIPIVAHNGLPTCIVLLPPQSSLGDLPLCGEGAS